MLMFQGGIIVDLRRTGVMLKDLDEVEVQKSGYVMIVTTIIHWLESPSGFNGFVCPVSEQSQYLS